MRFFAFLILLLPLSFLNGQGAMFQNWYWANQCALDFATSPPTVKQHKNKTYTQSGASCISDEVTGKLLFFTDGEYIYNENSDTIGRTGLTLNTCSDMVIVPLSNYYRRYLLVVNVRESGVNHRLRGFEIDATDLNAKEVIVGQRSFDDASEPAVLNNRITAIKHCFANGYWLIGIAYPYTFRSYYISASGVVEKPVLTAHHTLFPHQYSGDLVASSDGKYVVFTPYTENASDACRIYEFDSRCGKFQTTSREFPYKDDWSRSHGVAFSPDNKLVYIAYGYIESQLVQYSVDDLDDHVLIATSPQNFNQIALAPDGKIYITTHIDGVPSNKLDVISKPNVKGTGCNYIGDYVRTVGPTNFHVPNFITGWKGHCKENGSASIEISKNRCVGQPIEFKATINPGACDSLKWYFNDPDAISAHATKPIATYTYNKEGSYRPFLVMWFCGKRDTIKEALIVGSVKQPDLGQDRTICPGDSVVLDPGSADAAAWLWSDGSSSPTITVDRRGHYSVTVTKGECSLSDDVRVDVYPPIFTALGSEYFICEEEKELVKLDAGEGFVRYKWTPTGDTSQWIIVDKRGEYFVLVEDFRGCKGDQGTAVKSVCDMKLWFPSSFTPNGDGLNDVFKPSGQNIISVEILIFNRWGEEVYHSFDFNAGWDGGYLGNHAEDGVYVWKARATGYLNKRKVVNNYYGTVELIR